MLLLIIFAIGLSVGYVSRRYAFCIFGAIYELLALGTTKRILAVLSAMVLFGIVQFGAYEHRVEYPDLKYFLGGLLQGTGYFLAVGCPLGMLVRIGEGSKFHLLVFVGFLMGIALYVGVLDGLVSSFFNPVQYRHAITVPDLFR